VSHLERLVRSLLQGTMRSKAKARLQNGPTVYIPVRIRRDGDDFWIVVDEGVLSGTSNATRQRVLLKLVVVDDQRNDRPVCVRVIR